MAQIPSFWLLTRNFPYKPQELTPNRTGPLPAGATVLRNKVSMANSQLCRKPWELALI